MCFQKKWYGKKSGWENPLKRLFKSESLCYSVSEADRRFLRELTRVRSSRANRRDEPHKQDFNSRWTDFASEELQTDMYGIGERNLEAFMSTDTYTELVNGVVDPRNILNDLTGKDWLPETKSFFYQKGLGANHPEAQIEKLHPAPYSFQDIGHLVNFFTKRGMSVLDPFGGVGSTAKACEVNGRICTSICDRLQVKSTLPDNSTRLPIAFMKTCNWIVSERTRSLYPPKSLECLRLTEYGKEVAASLHSVKDLRLDEYYTYPTEIRKALIRLGVYSMLSRAGYDTSPVQDIIEQDKTVCANILLDKELLFSPYQTLHHSVVDEALGIKRTATGSRTRATILPDINRPDAVVNNISLTVTVNGVPCAVDAEVAEFTRDVLTLREEGKRKQQIIEKFFDESITATQTHFYPFVAMLFRVMGLDCQASRPGDNGARWDAIIVDGRESIPIEIKSPTEEQHLSLKAIRQALENKVILLSRETHPTLPETTSLAVGYYLPNDRAEVTNLMSDFKIAYGYNIGIMDLKTLLTIAVTIICDGKTFDIAELNRLEGFVNATFN